MKRLKKFLGIVLTLAVMFTMTITPAFAAPEVPRTTDVIIHKVVGTGEFTLQNHDGRMLTPTEIAALGRDAKEANTGVKFTVWLVDAGSNLDDFENMTNEQLKASHTWIEIDAGPELDGTGTPLPSGTYYVRETAHPATLESKLGVPFIMELPVLKVEPDKQEYEYEYLRTLHLYPKNVIEDDMPEIDKDVETKGQDSAGFDMGYNFDYFIYPKVPKGIESYTKFEVSDILSSKLNYVGNVQVTYIGKTETIILEPGTDYTILENSPEIPGEDFTVEFTAAGRQKLAANRRSAPEETVKDLEIKFQAKINNNAVMGEEIRNDAKLTYNNGYTSDKETTVPGFKQPKVHTGGHQFIKIDNVTRTYLTGLSSATFLVKNSDGVDAKYMKKENNIVNWVLDRNEATIISISASGEFEVTGLAYGDLGQDFYYWLEEDHVPDGYVRMDDLKFTINSGSYKNGTIIADNTLVINVKKPKIPQTGGIGTIIFLAIGLTMMGAAVVALKRREQIKK